MILRKIYYLLKCKGNLNAEAEQIENFRENLLERILEKCSDTGFYTDYWERNGFDPEEFDGLEDLQEVPILDRSTLKENIQEIRTDVEEVKTYSSSGTSGSMGSFGFDGQAADWREAITLRTEFLKGYKVFNSVAGNWALPVSRTGRLLRPSTEVPEDSTLEEQADIIREADPDYLVYGGHVLFRVARKIKLGKGFDGDIKAVFNNGELMTQEMRKVIQEVFGAEIHDVYETAEVGQIAWSCPEGGYHVNEDLVIAEIVDDDGEEVKPGETGSIVVTGLVNRNLPLVRYRIGDVVVKGENNCGCETEFGKIERIEGREKDVLVNDRGVKVYPRQVIDTLAEFSGLEKFLFKKTGSGFGIEYIPNRLAGKDLEGRIRAVFSELGFEDIDVRKVENIDRSGRKANPIRIEG